MEDSCFSPKRTALQRRDCPDELHSRRQHARVRRIESELKQRLRRARQRGKHVAKRAESRIVAVVVLVIAVALSIRHFVTNLQGRLLWNIFQFYRMRMQKRNIESERYH